MQIFSSRFSFKNLWCDLGYASWEDESVCKLLVHKEILRLWKKLQSSQWSANIYSQWRAKYITKLTIHTVSQRWCGGETVSCNVVLLRCAVKSVANHTETSYFLLILFFYSDEQSQVWICKYSDERKCIVRVN